MNTENLVSQFQLAGTSVRKMQVHNNFIFLDLEDEGVEKNISVAYEVNSVEDPEDEDYLTGILTLFIEVEISDDENELELKLHLHLEGGFRLSKSRDMEAFKEMLPVNGCAALYSIARGIVLSVTSQVCMNGGITLPMINTFTLVEETENKKNTEE